MLKVSILVLALAAISTTASANTVRPAKPGESCASFYKGCSTQCLATKGAKMQQNCNSACLDNRATCDSSGTWLTPKTGVRINKLPPN
ncbi:MAG: hypothetical protein Q8M19_14370 [Reyranella sp.]|nr:hypothetical protein [Reyranella sp.]